MSLKIPALPSRSNAPPRVAPGSGAAGAFWMLTIGVGNGVGVSPVCSCHWGVPVVMGLIGVGSSGLGDSSQRQKRVSSFFSQELQAPITASAKTPLVGTDTR